VPIAAALGAAAYVLVVIAPIAALAAATVPRLARDPRLALLAWPSERLPLLLRSVALAGLVAAAGTVVGVLVALVLWRRRSGRLGAARWGLVALAVVPAYVHALAWSDALAALAGLAAGPGTTVWMASGWWVAAWVQLMALLPLSVGLCLLALETVPDEAVEAGRLYRADTVVLRSIVLPLARPALLVAATVVFVLALLDYSVPSLFRVNVYALAVFARFSAGYDPIETFLTALPIVVVALVAVVVSQSRLRRVAQRPVRRGAVPMRPMAWPRWLRLAIAGACTVVALQILVPVAALSGRLGSPRALVDTLAGARSEASVSIVVAGLAAAVCVPLALAAARGMAAGGADSRLWWLLATVPLAIPASLVGVALIAVWNRPGLASVYGGLAMPVLAGAARFAPLAALAVFAHERRLDRMLLDAERVHRPSAIRGWLEVRLTLLAPGLLAAICVAFALTLGELGATVVVAPPGRQTLTVKIFNYLHYGASDAVAGLCLAMAALALAAGAAAVLAPGWTRRAERGEGGP
jgi:iron(III) transport system permease protein